MKSLVLAGIVMVGGFACAPSESAAKEAKAKPTAGATSTAAATPGRRAKPSDAQLKQELTAIQYDVTQHEGTEPPFKNSYWDNHAAGVYVDIVTGEPLFTSLDKYDSGTGWPSFVRPISASVVVEKTDGTGGMARTEVRSASSDSHLGHVFDDGPAPTGLRYCMNSAALRFIPVAELATSGYPELVARFTPTR